MKKLLRDVNKLHINYEVLAAAILQMGQKEQGTVNNLIIKVLGLPEGVDSAAIKRKRQMMANEISEYNAMLDVFDMLKKVTHRLNINRVDCGADEVLADAEMLIRSFNDENG